MYSLKLLLRALIAQTLIVILSLVRPLLGPSYCYFSVSCTVFAKKQLGMQSLPWALLLITRRLILCSPLYPFVAKYGKTNIALY